MAPDRTPSQLEQQIRDAEQRAVEQQIHFQGRLLDSVRQAVLATDPQGRVTFWNRYAEELYGWKAEEVLGRSVLDATRAESVEQASSIMEAVARGESWTGEFEAHTRTGRVFTALVTNSPVLDADGRLLGIISVSQDISELHDARTTQAALAHLGTIALGNAGLGFLFTRSAEAVRELLGADCGEIHKSDGEEIVVVGRAGFSEGAEAIERRGGLAHAAIASPLGVAIEAGDAAQPLPRGSDPGDVSGISVAIATSDQSRWGALTAWLAEPRRVASAQVDFLRALANLLGQAIDRRRAEVELLIRASQQSALAEIGRLTSAGVSAETLARICELVMQGLGVEHAAVLQPGVDGQFVAIAGEAPPAGVALDHARDVAESAQSSILLERKGFSGIASPMVTGQRSFGVVSGYTRVAKHFTNADVHFMESVAFVVAEAADREAARSQLVESEKRFRSVIEGASEIIFSVTPAGIIQSINPAFEGITGWRVEDWLGRHFDGLLVDEEKERVAKVFHTMLAEPRHVRMHVRMQGKGRVVLVDAATSPKVLDGEIVEIYGFARDVTEEHRLEAKLEQANRLSSLGRLAAMVAHEFNNVLMGIAPFTELLRRESLTERGKTAVEQITRAVKRGKRITEDILRFAQPAEPALATVVVGPWLQALAVEAQSLIGPKYTIAVEADGDISIAADANQLHQAFVNLILNARDSMPQGGRIRIAARPEEKNVHFVVQDWGVGMKPETMDRIFEPLFTTKKSGTGLGLPVTRQVVARHGGEIFVESTPTEGSSFHLLVPAAGPVLAGEVTQSETAGRLCRSVLLVEDEPSVAAGIAALLESEGVAVRVVGTGAEVLPALAQEKPDAVVLDIGLPDIDGTVVFKSIANTYPDLPVVFSSGHGDAAKLEQFLSRSNVGFLLKPYDIDALLQMLNRVVA